MGTPKPFSLMPKSNSTLPLLNSLLSTPELRPVKPKEIWSTPLGLISMLSMRLESPLAKRLSDMTHLNDKFTAYAPLINSFAQIASSSNNPQLLAQITSLLTTLKNQIAATRAADARWEDRKAAAWAKELADLTAQRDSLTERRNALQAQIVNYN